MKPIRTEPIKAACWFASFLGVLVQGQFQDIVEGQMPITAQMEPVFLQPLENHTVTPGREAVFTCVVNHLSDYRIAWIKSDSKTILAMHTTMVAVNPRISVTYNGYNTWKLHINNIEANDSGTYMCQINTIPVKSQMGHLSVVIPPDIIDTGGRQATGEAREGGTIVLSCMATGVPDPTVTWKRERGKQIVIRYDGGREKKVVPSQSGEILQLSHVQRSDMGVYYCIASNGVPPTVSRRYHVHVHFPPTIKVSNQLVAAPLGSDVIVQCYVEASPRAMNSWYRSEGEKLLDSNKFLVSEEFVSDYGVWMNLTIQSLDRRDYGSYICASANALGRVEGTVRLQELQLTGVGMYGTARGHNNGKTFEIHDDDDRSNGGASYQQKEETLTHLVLLYIAFKLSLL